MAVPKATWIVKVGDGMPSFINVQGQVQMATACIPGNGPDAAAYRIQSVFLPPADVCNMAHIWRLHVEAADDDEVLAVSRSVPSQARLRHGLAPALWWHGEQGGLQLHFVLHRLQQVRG